MKPVKRSNSDNYAILKEFLNSNDDCVKIEDWTHKNVNCCAVSMRTSIKHFYPNQIKVIQKGRDVYLVKTEAIK